MWDGWMMFFFSLSRAAIELSLTSTMKAARRA